MMGEYILYYHGKIAAYLCDDRLLIKPVAAAKVLLPNAPLEAPYPGAGKMLLVENLEDPIFFATAVPRSRTSTSLTQETT